MKKFLISSFPILALGLLAGCASYNAHPLGNPSAEVVAMSAVGRRAPKVVVTAKEFSSADCKHYLDRDVIREGYKPVQLCIQNLSDSSYLFSLNRLSVGLARPEEVADRVHTSTVGRAVGYGVGALFIWPLAIPAVLDGIWSAQANDALDSDFAAKAAQDQVIPPHASMNKIVFIPASEYRPPFIMKLVNQKSGEIETLQVQPT